MIFGRSRRARWDGTSGRPRSSNGASSLHLGWDAPVAPADDPWVAAEAVLEVRSPPEVLSLYFWALQASFTDRGRHGGAGHLGLQWYPAHPGSTAVSWGGYGPDGRELDGSMSTLPSATGNPNTRDFRWSPGTPYRLRIERFDPAPPDTRPTGVASATPTPAAGELRSWRGTVTDLDSGDLTVVRELWAPGRGVEGLVVWSEVFAPCDAPRTEVHWSDLRLTAGSGRTHAVSQVTVNYQEMAEGGCVTTDARVDGAGVAQVTGTTRTTPKAARLPVGQRAPGGTAG
jgi:hypothetical protein